VPAPKAAPRIPASESLGALAMFHSYAATVGMSQPALDAALDLLRVSPSVAVTAVLPCNTVHYP
jgi:hypothetical protein